MESKKQKTCTKCKQELSVDAFYKDAQKRDGRTCICKKCCDERSAKYYLANLERIKAYQLANSERIKAYQLANSERIKASRAKWAKNNPEKVKASRAKHYLANPERHKASSAKWAKNNPEKVKAMVERNVVKIRERVLRHYHANKEMFHKRAVAKSAALSTNTVAWIICKSLSKQSLHPRDVPQELVDAKRHQLIAYRLINEKEKNHGCKNTDQNSNCCSSRSNGC